MTCRKQPRALLQVVKELKGTAYRPTVAILGSKSQYCANGEVTGASTMGVDEGCEALLDSDRGCKYKMNAPTLAALVQQRPSMRVRPRRH
jgi:DEAD_2